MKTEPLFKTLLSGDSPTPQAVASVKTMATWETSTPVPSTEELRKTAACEIQRDLKVDKLCSRIDAQATIEDLKISVAHTTSVVGYPLGGPRGSDEVFPMGVRTFTATYVLKEGNTATPKKVQGYVRFGNVPGFGYELMALLGAAPEPSLTRADYNAKNTRRYEHATLPTPTRPALGSGDANQIRRQAMNTLVSAHTSAMGARMQGMQAMMAAALNPFDKNFMAAWMGQDIKL